MRTLSQPAVIEKDGLSIAIFVYCMYGNPWLGYVEMASKDKAGINPLIIEKVIEDIKRAKSKYDRVIVMPHWGREYQYEPLREAVYIITNAPFRMLVYSRRKVQSFVRKIYHKLMRKS